MRNFKYIKHPLFQIFLIVLFLSTLVFSSFGQYFEGIVQEDYTISINKKEASLPKFRNNHKNLEQLESFPKSFVGDTNSKNFRNVTLADVDGDGIDDILFAANNQLLAFSRTELLWTKTMVGTGIYPPSVADIDNDGTIEIIQATGGNGRSGRLYVMDNNGADRDGFPKNFSNHWILTTPALADLDNDGNLEIIFLERDSPGGNVHIIKNDGTPFNSNWPIRLPRTPAVTPSIGDIDNDGAQEIVVASTTTLYAYDLQGQLEEGWPVDNPDTRFSFQSPILRDLDDDGDLEIIGASHGNTPEFYIFNHDGSPYKSWPFFVPEREWTFSTPSVVNLNGITQIFMSRPIREEAADMLYAWDEAGFLQDGFPIVKQGGLEGIITIADIDEDDEMELLFGSNRLDEEGFGFIHAFNMDGTEVLEGFPLRPQGWTLLNGAALGDVNGDNLMDLIALTYTTNAGVSTDSVFLNVYNLDIPYSPEKIRWSTYKGNNLRNGNLQNLLASSTLPSLNTNLRIDISPNPIVVTGGNMTLSLNTPLLLNADIINTNGQIIQHFFTQKFSQGTHQIALPALPAGLFFIEISSPSYLPVTKKIIVIK